MPLLRSWVASAKAPDHPFPLNNLPNIRTAGDLAREIERLTA